MVGCGTMLGATLRVFLSQFNSQFPWMTLLINTLGSFLLGVFTHFDGYLFFGTGIMGGFTTFSTFAFETVSLFESERKYAVLYLFLSRLLTILAFLSGMLIF